MGVKTKSKQEVRILDLLSMALAEQRDTAEGVLTRPTHISVLPLNIRLRQDKSVTDNSTTCASLSLRSVSKSISLVVGRSISLLLLGRDKIADRACYRPLQWCRSKSSSAARAWSRIKSLGPLFWRIISLIGCSCRATIQIRNSTNDYTELDYITDVYSCSSPA